MTLIVGKHWNDKVMKQQTSTIELTPHQQEIFDAIVEQIEEKTTAVLKSTRVEDFMLSLAGPAGTGKTFLTTKIAEYLKEKRHKAKEPNIDYDFIITAPTHKAVSVITEHLYAHGIDATCKTIHSFLGIKPFIDYQTGEEKYTVDKTKKNKERTSILIVDESSMVGKELYEYIVESIEQGIVNLVIFIGDPYQLMPVNGAASPVFELDNAFSLTEVVRQARQSIIIEIATEIRKHIEHETFVKLDELFKAYQNRHEDLQLFYNQTEFLSDFHRPKNWFDKDRIVASYKNADVDAFNRQLRKAFWLEKGVQNPPALLPEDRLRFKEAPTRLKTSRSITTIKSSPLPVPNRCIMTNSVSITGNVALPKRYHHKNFSSSIPTASLASTNISNVSPKTRKKPPTQKIKSYGNSTTVSKTCSPRSNTSTLRRSINFKEAPTIRFTSICFPSSTITT